MSSDTTSQVEPNQAVLDSRLIERFEVHRDFAKVFLDAFILINSKRRVLKFNQAFCAMLGQRAIDIRKASSVEELFLTEIQGSTKSAVDLIMESSGSIRIDEVQAHRVHDSAFMQLILSSYPYFDSDGTLLGACVLTRDVTAESNLQGKYKERTIQSITDPLTGLFTRRYFEEWMDKELERCRRQDICPGVGILMFDLDKFKNVNDTYGHQAGDYVLSETAKVLQESSRRSDIVGRFGGEELIVILMGATTHGYCVAAEKLRQAIQNCEYVFEGSKIPVTASVGVSCFLTPSEEKAAVIKRADACLYSAKKDGRNVVYADFGEGQFKVLDYFDKEETDRKTTTEPN